MEVIPARSFVFLVTFAKPLCNNSIHVFIKGEKEIYQPKEHARSP